MVGIYVCKNILVLGGVLIFLGFVGSGRDRG